MRVPAIRGSKPQTATTGQEVEGARPQPVRTPVRALGRLALSLKCRPPMRPHEPSIRPSRTPGGGIRLPPAPTPSPPRGTLVGEGWGGEDASKALPISSRVRAPGTARR